MSLLKSKNMQKKKTYPSHESVGLAGKIVLEDGKLRPKLNSPVLLNHFLQTYCKIGDDFSMLITNKKPKRSIAQNSFYHLYLSLISISSGNTVEELKAWVKDTILLKGISEVFGDSVRITDSSANLSISEFTEMMNRIEDKTEIPIPDPEPFNIPLTLLESGKLKEIQKQKYKSLKSNIHV